MSHHHRLIISSPSPAPAARPASRWGTQKWPNLRLKWPPKRRQSTWAHPTRLDLSTECRLKSTSKDLRRSEVVINLCEHCTHTVDAYSIHKVFYSFGWRLLLLSFLEKSSYRQLKLCVIWLFWCTTAMLYGIFGSIVAGRFVLL